MMTTKKKTVWETLTTDEVKIEVDEHRQKKGNLDYLSWAWAWGKLKDHYPDASFEKHWFESGDCWVPYSCDEHGFAYVQVAVTVEGSTLTETLPVLNHNNKPVTKPDSFEVNTALQRCLCKAIAYHGLGFHIYAGEDLQDYTPDKPVKKVEKEGPVLAKAVTENPVVAAAQEKLGAEIKTVTSEVDYHNTYDSNGVLLHGFDDDTLTFVMDASVPVDQQHKYVSDHMPGILKTISTTDDLSKLLGNSSTLLHTIAKSTGIAVGELDVVKLIKNHKT